jgi:hypothetical protein
MARVLTMVEDEYPLPMGSRKKVMKMSLPTNWKLDNGQWCYYLEPTPQKTAAEPAKAPEAGAAGAPKMGQPPPGVKVADLPRLANEVTASKQEFTIADNTDGTDEIVITNGLTGPVRLVTVCRRIAGLECKTDKEFIGHGGQAKLTLRFKFSGAKLPQNVIVALWVEPFHNLMQFPIVTR